MKRIRRNLFNTIRKKMLFYFILTIVMISFTSILTFNISRKFINQMDYMFVNSVYLEKLSDNLKTVDENLINFLSTKSSDRLNDYIMYSDRLREQAKFISKNQTYEYSQLLLIDISNMIDTFLTETDAAVEAKRGRNINEYIERYNNATKIAGYIQMYINKLNINQLQNNTQHYMTLAENIKILQTANVVIIVGIILLALLIIFYTTYTMTKPIIKLSHSAEEISKGNFQADEVIVSSEDEIKVMAEAFNNMKKSIQKYIEELQNKSETEAKLMEQKMQNLKMQILLDNAELQALQSQINPHFLFNTINAGVQLSMIEGADRTSIFLENLASLFRYNIQKLDKKVTLRDEINNVKAYYDVLKERFGDLIEFEYDIDDSLLDVEILPLILQPLVENACIHGIGESESGGIIKISVGRMNDNVRVCVEDNGKGMSEETLKKIEKESKKSEIIPQKTKKGHTTGIGLNNVIHRLNLFFEGNNILKIESKEGKGTKIILDILDKGGRL